MRSEIIYNSDIIISDPQDLAVLCIFYDKVYLPHSHLGLTKPKGSISLLSHLTPQLASTLMRLPNTLNALKLTRVTALKSWDDPDLPYLLAQVFEDDQSHVYNWTMENIHLFRHGLLERLPFVDDSATTLDSALQSDYVAISMTDGSFSVFDSRLLSHLARLDLALPQVFMTEEGRHPRELLKVLEVKSLFHYWLPATVPLNAEQILEVHQKVSDTREGFAMHLQSLSKGISDRVHEGDSLESIETFANDVVETMLIPDYREFCRQINSQRAGFWGKVLEKANRVFEITAPVGSPRFMFDVLRAALPVGLTYEAEAREQLSNKMQAYQFMRLVEGALTPNQ